MTSLRILGVMLLCSLVGTPIPSAGFPIVPSPNGAALVKQLTSAYTADPTKGIEQRVFLSSDAIAFKGTYLDPNDACLPVDTEQVYILVAKASGQLTHYLKADSGHYDGRLSDYYRGFNLPFRRAGASFPLGGYIWTVLAVDCTGAVVTVLPYYNSFQVIE